MRTWIGTSGFQYKEWRGKFYPEGMSLPKMLAYYADRFTSTEINYTFKRTPSAATIRRWSDETPKEFRLALKAPQGITHFARLKDCNAAVAEFFEAIHDLGAKRGPVLFQLPPNLKADPALLGALLTTLPKNLRAAFEFRHESWFTDEVYGVLAKRNAALCIAESEEITTPRIATADFGYLRPRREDYTPVDLKKLAKFVREQSGKWNEMFAYFKHEETCVGPGFAKALMTALARRSHSHSRSLARIPS